MAKLTKPELAQLSNVQLSQEIDLSTTLVETAFKNYNKFLNRIIQSNLSEKETIHLFLQQTEVKEIKDVDIKLSTALLQYGVLEKSMAELFSIEGINTGTIKALIQAMQNPDNNTPSIETNARVETTKKNRTPRAHYNGLKSLSALSEFGSKLISTPNQALPVDKLYGLDSLADDLEKIKDLLEEGKDITEAGKDIIDNIKKAKDIIEDKKKNGNTGTQPRNNSGTVTTGEQVPEEVDTNIEEDEYYDYYEDALTNEPLYSVWLDRLMAFEVDGVGDDNIFWTSQVTVFLNNPRKIIRSSFISNMYDIDEREEYRLKPKAPIAGKRDKPLPKHDWHIRGFIDEKDAGFALKVNGLIRGIPLSKLDKIEIAIYVYESDSVNQLIEATAAIGAAGIAALGIVKGKFTAPKGSTQEASDAIERGLKKLNRLINSDDLVLSGTLTYTKTDFTNAFTLGETFPYPEQGIVAAIGMPNQRIAEAKLETNDVLDTGSLDTYLQDEMPSDKNKLKDFLENNFESYYEVRFRFEKEEPRK